MKLCGYRGPKPFFSQQPMPGRADIQLSGGHKPHRNNIVCAFTKQADYPPRMGESVPCEIVNAAAELDMAKMRNTALPKTHPN
ncbi:hypothetical protein TSMEX_008538 [Taenia solium]|eukprot:TsM_000654900 transcript=TsM_000654900 gene=TsM_000654900